MRARTALHLLLGLVFLAQGTLASAAAYRPASHAAAAAHASAMTLCMKHSGLKGGCCNTACPDMASCSLSSMAAAPTLGVALTFVAAAPRPVLGSHAPVRVSTFLLRPPITLHG